MTSTRSHRYPLLLAAPLVALALLVAGCGSGSDTDAGSGSGASSAAAEPHDDADVTFAQQMVPHHQQALAMVDLADGRPLDPGVARVVAAIEDAQAPEIEQMQGWLADWGVETDDSPSGMGGMGYMGGEMPGMMSGAEMTGLETASDARFQDRWLRLMIAHHEGALSMARTELEDGENDDALALARSILRGQRAQIATMRSLLDR